MADAVVASAGPLARVDGLRGIVHALFASSAYVETEDGAMLVIHRPGHGHTPTSLIVDGARPATWDATPGDAVAGRLGHLRIGAMRLDARQARNWRPRAALRRDRAVPAGPLTQIVRATAGDAFARLEPDCVRLADALAAGDFAATAASVSALVGTGPGLTPSGDDALVGLLAALHRAAPGAAGLREPAARLRECLAAAVVERLDRTTAISAHYLRLALGGHFGEHLTDLVDGLAANGSVAPELVARVHAIGATSGADALVGAIAGLRACEAMDHMCVSSLPHRLSALCTLASIDHPVEDMA